MNFDKAQEIEPVFTVEIIDKQIKKQQERKIIRDTEKRLRKMAICNLNGKMGEC